MTPSLNERFGISVNRDEAERRFVARAHLVIWKSVRSFMNTRRCADILNAIALEIGKLHVIPKTEGVGYDLENVFRNDLYNLLKHDLHSALLALETVRTLLLDGNLVESANDEAVEQFDDWVSTITSKDGDALNVRYDDGSFWPAGAPELDEGLVKEPLRWLRRHNLDSVYQPFEKGLRHFLRAPEDPALFQDSITDCYEALEALAKLVTGMPNRDLSGARQKFVSTLNLNQDLGKLLKPYVAYGGQFRHGQNKPRDAPSREEAEFYVYITGSFIRIALERKEQWKDIG